MINAEKCAAYLRSIGVDVSAELRAAWVAQQAKHRRDKRSVMKGVQFRCFDCGRIWQAVAARVVDPPCPDCHSKRRKEYWLLWYQTADGVVHNTDAVRHSLFIKKTMGLEP